MFVDRQNTSAKRDYTIDLRIAYLEAFAASKINNIGTSTASSTNTIITTNSGDSVDLSEFAKISELNNISSTTEDLASRLAFLENASTTNMSFGISTSSI